VSDVIVERLRQRFGTHAKVVVDRNFDDVLAADAERDRTLLDVRVRLVGDVHAQYR